MTLVNPFHKFLCPYCFERYHISECDVVSGATTGKVLEPAPKDYRKYLYRVWVPPLSGPDYTRELASRRCPNSDSSRKCGNLWPHNIEYMDNRIIAIVGGTFSGKSTYIASLIKQLEREPVLRNVGCKEFFPLPGSDTEDRYEREYYEPLWMRREVLPPNKPTPNDKFVKPLVFVMVFCNNDRWRTLRRVNLIVFDTAGEELVDPVLMAQVSRYVLNASGIIFLIDPLTMPGIADQLPLHLQPKGAIGTEGFRTVQRAASMIRRHRGISEGSSIPVPAVFTLVKSDLLRFPLNRGGNIGLNSPILCDSDYSHGFNVGDYEKVSRDVETLVNEKDGPALSQARSSFQRASFAAVAPTGCSSDATGHYLQMEPRRCADPLIWLLWQMGFIRAYR